MMKRDDPPPPPGSGKDAPSKGANTSKMTPLADDFEPGQDDVVCGRGKKCYNHVGNTRFRHRVVAMLDEYSRAKSKLDKSNVLSRVMEQVRRASPEGGFVKQDDSGKWYEVGDFLAREKTSQAFRDALHERYKSSNISKKKKRQQEQAKASDKVQQIARSEQEISARLERLSQELAGGGSDTQALFDRQTNLDMIARLNKLVARHQQQNIPFSARSALHPGATQQLRFPDPLFSQNLGLRNASPAPSITFNEPASASRFPGEAALPQRSSSYSYPPSVARLPTTTTSDEVSHSSMPNIHFGVPPSLPRIERSDDSQLTGLPSLNTSLPNIDFFDRVQQDVQRRVASAAAAAPPLNQLMEPFAMDPMRVEREERHKQFVANRDVASLKSPPPAASLKEAPPSSLQHDPPDKDLLACLEKLTEHSIADDNPFEPIPIAEDRVQPKQMDDTSSPPISPIRLRHTFQYSPPPPDDETHNEFAEG